MAVSSTHNGWRYDPSNSRLDFYFRGTRAGHINASGAQFTGTLGVTGATTLSSTLAVTGTSTLTGAVALDSTFSYEGLLPITDPGDAGAIPVTKSGYCPIVTGGAETRTVADASFVGQMLLLSLKTDGGDAVVTFASPVNQAGNNTATFADVGDSQMLIGVEDGSDIEWREFQNDGAGLTTV